MSATHLSRIWSRLLAATWVLAAVAYGFVSVASRRTGKPLWWVDDHGIIGNATPVLGAAIVYLSMLGAFVTALRSVRWAPSISAAVAVGLGACAAVDISTAPGAALVSLAASGAALLASVAALAGLSARN